jgi:hypothetical protein
MTFLPLHVVRSFPHSSVERDECLGPPVGTNIPAYFRRGVPTTGVREIAFVPPAYVGNGSVVPFL